MLTLQNKMVYVRELRMRMQYTIKRQNWIDIIKAAREIFLGNSETYKQALDCDHLLFAMSKVENKLYRWKI